MKTIGLLSVILILVTINLKIQGQTTINSETSFKADTNQFGIPVNRLEIKQKFWSLKYDYKTTLTKGANPDDVLGLFFPKLYSDSTTEVGLALIKLGDHKTTDRIVVDASASKQFTKLFASLEIGRIFNPIGDPNDYFITRLGTKELTAEGGILTQKAIYEPAATNVYAWLAYHPQHFYVAVGNEIQRNWLLLGTKNLQNWGNFTFANYDRATGNFWFKSQTGILDINQNFFNQELYNIAASYFIVPPFFYKHFSPLTTKGKYTLKLEGKKSGGQENYEVMVGQKIDDILQVAFGMNSERQLNKLRVAPSLEIYKDWSKKDFKAAVEIRYDCLTQSLTAYLALNYKF